MANTPNLNEAELAKKIHAGFDSSETIALVNLKRVRPTPSPQTKREIDFINENGYIILENVLTPEEVALVKSEIDRIVVDETRKHGRNNFEGRVTSRPYSILAKSRAFDKLAIHERILNILDQLLIPNYLLTTTQAIVIHPGETRQPYHYDDAPCIVPRPRQYFSIATIWAIDDFTETNGSTELFPKSHLWDSWKLPEVKNAIPCVMKSGSVVVMLGTLWHGGGENISDSDRRAITFQYCEPYIRPQENHFLSVPFDVAKTLDPKIQSMLGYSIHPPFIGHVDGNHPLKRLAKL